MSYYQTLNLCIKPTGFGYICPRCGCDSAHLLSVTSPRFIREGSIAEYRIPIIKCMKCDINIEGIKYLANPEEVKKQKKESFIIFIVGFLFSMTYVSILLYALGLF